jgi:hypothetical protein
MALRLVVAGFLAVGCAVGAVASPKTKRTAWAKPKIATAVNVENKRLKSLLTFELIAQGKDKKSDTIVGRLEKPLAGGASVSVLLTGAKGCVFEARWKFEDVDDSGTVDLCKDAHIVLID